MLHTVRVVVAVHGVEALDRVRAAKGEEVNEIMK